jgi:HK97 gp10 family phage protein
VVTLAKASVKVIGLDKAVKDIERYIAKKNRELIGVVATSSKAIQSDARQLAPIDLGELKKSITHVVTQRSGRIDGEILSAAPYSAYVEFGTSPHFPPISALQGWADRHGIPAYAVAKSIARKGTPAQPFMDPAYRKEKPKFIENVIRTFNTP